VPDVLAWLLEPDNPSARYLALRDLLGRGGDDREVQTARQAIPGWGPAKAILEAQWPAGYWVAPGVGYSPRYRATVWQVIFLAALGGPCTEAIERACAYVLDHSRLPDGRFSAHKTAKGAVACLNGNLLRAMLQLGCTDPRLEQVATALARTVVREGFRCPLDASDVSDGLSCGWATVKVLGAFAELPEEQRSPLVGTAIEAGVALLLAGDLASGGFATSGITDPLWKPLGFPLGESADLLEALEVLARHGVTRTPALDRALAVVRRKQDRQGRWALEYTPQPAWASFGEVGRPNKWVTLRALRVLRLWEG